MARHASDIIHGGVVILVCILATVYNMGTDDHSNNIWIIYGSAISFAAGRSGVAAVQRFSRATDPPSSE